VTLVPNASFTQRDGVTFTGDLAISTTYNTYYSFLNFYDATDPLNLRLIGNKLLTATPDTLSAFNSAGTYHQLGFAKGLATIRMDDTHLAAYAAVEQVGLMLTDVGNTIPERTPLPDANGQGQRVKEAIYPGDFTDVAAFHNQLIAVDRTGKQLVVLDPALSPRVAIDLPQRPRKLLVVSSYPTDDNHDGVVDPSELRDLAIIGTEDTRIVNGVPVSDGSIFVVDITNLDAPQIISTIPMPAAVHELDVDSTKQRLFAGTLAVLYMIDLSRPVLTG